MRDVLFSEPVGHVMSLAILTQLLKDAIGLDATSIGASAVERAVRERQRACNLASCWTRTPNTCNGPAPNCSSSSKPSSCPRRGSSETASRSRRWRGRLPDEWLRTDQEGVYRLLSVPCATGEEPYSMAMALLESGFAPSRFRVDAVDISERVLAVARRAVYGRSLLSRHRPDLS